MIRKLNWGILGTGYIAETFARAIGGSASGALQAVGSRSQEKAERFAETFNAKKACGNFDAVLADPAVDAVYIATPHPTHAEWVIRAAAAGKHVLCEKPMAMNHSESSSAIDAVRRSGVFFMEALAYRCHPQAEKLIELVRTRVIGDVRFIHATFGFNFPFDPNHATLDHRRGGGAIMDVGCYCTSMAGMIAGAFEGKSYAEPVDVTGSATIGKISRVDECSVGTLKYSSGVIAFVGAAVQARMDNTVRISGSEGELLVNQPWLGGREGENLKILLKKTGAAQFEEIPVQTPKPLYSLEADAFAELVRTGQYRSSLITAEDSLANMRVLDRWRQAVGMKYDFEK